MSWLDRQGDRFWEFITHHDNAIFLVFVVITGIAILTGVALLTHVIISLFK